MALSVTYLNGHRRAVQRALEQVQTTLVPGLDVATIDAKQQIAGAKTGAFGNRTFEHPPDHRLDTLDARHVYRPVGQYREQKIRQRPGEHNGHAFPHRLAVEGARQFFRSYLAFGFIQHFHVTAERQRGHHELHLIGTDASRP